VSVTALIPARGGSKGIPRKNLRTIHGETLLARCIRTCRLEVRDVMVSTDCEEIADESRRHGAGVHWRPHRLATDGASTWAVVRDAMGAIKSDVIVLAQCTAPAMTAGDIHRCINRLETCDVAVACHEAHVWLVDAHGRPINWTLPPKLRQETEPQYAFSGSCWAFRRDYLDLPEMSGRIGVVVSENPVRIDIDTEDDLRTAEVMLTS